MFRNRNIPLPSRETVPLSLDLQRVKLVFIFRSVESRELREKEMRAFMRLILNLVLNIRGFLFINLNILKWISDLTNK